jgi:dihydroorotase-like cyclic amidohydrolase
MTTAIANGLIVTSSDEYLADILIEGEQIVAIGSGLAERAAKVIDASAETHHSRCDDYNIFEGTEVSGAPEIVLVCGRVIVENDSLQGTPGDGRFVRRARSRTQGSQAGRYGDVTHIRLRGAGES